MIGREKKFSHWFPHVPSSQALAVVKHVAKMPASQTLWLDSDYEPSERTDTSAASESEISTDEADATEMDETHEDNQDNPVFASEGVQGLHKGMKCVF
jgi:hypothetical protein